MPNIETLFAKTSVSSPLEKHVETGYGHAKDFATDAGTRKKVFQKIEKHVLAEYRMAKAIVTEPAARKAAAQKVWSYLKEPATLTAMAGVTASKIAAFDLMAHGVHSHNHYMSIGGFVLENAINYWMIPGIAAAEKSLYRKAASPIAAFGKSIRHKMHEAAEQLTARFKEPIKVPAASHSGMMCRNLIPPVQLASADHKAHRSPRSSKRYPGHHNTGSHRHASA